MNIFSETLKNLGLNNQIGGIDFNFRYFTQKLSVVKDTKKLLKIMGEEDIEDIYSAFQIHSNNIEEALVESTSAFVYGRIAFRTDGLITNRKNVALLIKFADCTPILIYDPIKKVQASVHSGWRGTSKQITKEALKIMQEKYFCKKEDLQIFLGPSIGKDRYEVGGEVYEAFKVFPKRDDFFALKNNGKYLLDMISANLSLLESLGISKNQIEICPYDTYSCPFLHSARLEGKDYGNNAIISVIK